MCRCTAGYSLVIGWCLLVWFLCSKTDLMGKRFFFMYERLAILGSCQVQQVYVGMRTLTNSTKWSYSVDLHTKNSFLWCSEWSDHADASGWYYGCSRYYIIACCHQSFWKEYMINMMHGSLSKTFQLWIILISLGTVWELVTFIFISICTEHNI